jgi:hypothetical protein
VFASIPPCCTAFARGGVCKECQLAVSRARQRATGDHDGYAPIEVGGTLPIPPTVPICLGLRLCSDDYLRREGWEWRHELPAMARPLFEVLVSRVYGPACNTMLANPDLARFSTHVCPDFFPYSLMLFAQRNFCWRAEDVEGPTGKGMVQYGSPERRKYADTFPLPVGTRSMQLYAEKRGISLTDLPNPLFDGDELLALVLRHKQAAGTVTLFGLWEQSEVEQQDGVQLSLWRTLAPRIRLDYAKEIPRTGDPLEVAKARMETWYRDYVRGTSPPFIGRL